MNIYEYYTIDESITFHTISKSTIPQGASIHKILPIEDYYSTGQILSTFFHEFYRNEGWNFETYVKNEKMAYRQAIKEIMDVPFNDRSKEQTDNLNNLYQEIGVVEQLLKKELKELPNKKYTSSERYQEIIDDCFCTIIFGESDSFKFKDITQAVNQFRDFIINEPMVALDFYVASYNSGSLRAFQYRPHTKHESLAKVA